MKVEVGRLELKKALGAAMRVVAVKAQLPMLANVLLVADKRGLRVAAANLEMGMELELGAKVETGGKAAVPARVLAELVGNLAGEKVKLVGEGLKLKVEAAGGRSEVMGMEPGEFPPVAEFPKAAALTIERKEYLRAMRQVGFAAAMDESRPVLTAVLVKKGEQGLEMVATDGFRLSRVIAGSSHSASSGQASVSSGSKKGEKKEVDKKGEGKEMGGKKRAKFEVGGEGQWLVPVKALQEAARLMEETEGKGELEMGLTEGKNQVVFKVDGVALSSRLVEGTFPDYEKILPEAWSSRMEVEKEELVRNLKLVGVFARESANVVKLVLGKSGLKLTGESATLGKGEGETEGKLEGDEAEVAFNYRYVLDFLNAAGGSEVVLELAGPVAPGVWKSAGEEGWLHMVMPVRLQNDKTG